MRMPEADPMKGIWREYDLLLLAPSILTVASNAANQASREHLPLLHDRVA